MQRTLWMRRMAALAALAMVAAACGGDGEGEDTTSESEPTAASEPATSESAAGSEQDVEATGKGDGTLTIGYVLPESGQLATLGVPQITAVELAIEDINAAGGVLGGDVNLITGDSGTDPAVARETVARELNEGADAIIGAAASGVSQEIIQTLFNNEIVQCSASNTSPAFSTQENAGFYFRTVPPDEAVSPIIADEVVQDGAQNVAVVARADDYGNALAELVNQELESLGAQVSDPITYDPNTTGFDSEVQQISSQNPDSVVVIGFAESATLIRQLVESGIPADGLYGADGIFDPTLEEQVGGGQGFIDGMKVIGAAGTEEFNAQLNEALPEDQQGNLIYGGQAYDCAIVIALAAQAAQSDDPSVFVDEILNVTKEGTACSSFEECSGLLEQGEDIDYNGASGGIDLAPGGEGEASNLGDPTAANYAIGQFSGGGLEIAGSQQVDLGGGSGGSSEAASESSS